MKITPEEFISYWKGAKEAVEKFKKDNPPPKRDFELGDLVKVISGKCINKVGRIVLVLLDEDQPSFCSSGLRYPDLVYLVNFDSKSVINPNRKQRVPKSLNTIFKPNQLKKL